MTSTKIADWLQIVGTFGLIAGLVLVAVQIEQNTEIARAQMVSEGRNLAVAIKLAVVGEGSAKTLAKALDTPERLTTEDMVVLEHLQFANYYLRSREEMVFNLGFGTPTTLANPASNAVASIAEFLSTPFGLAWWEVLREGPWENGAPTTAAYIDSILADEPRFGFSDRYSSIAAKLGIEKVSEN